MGGKSKIKLHVYYGDGSYKESFDSISEFRADYYPNDIGKRPILTYNEKGVNYHYSKEGDWFVTDCRPGREAIKHIIAIHESEYCKLQDNVDNKPVRVFNLRGDLIAEFKSVRLCGLMVPSLANSNISRQLHPIRKVSNKVKCGLRVAYSPIEEEEEEEESPSAFVDPTEIQPLQFVGLELLVSRMRESTIRNILNIKEDQLDAHYITTSKGSFTRREMAREIENNTEIGRQQLESLIKLTLFLLEKGEKTI
jgi:hypothetical protein